MQPNQQQAESLKQKAKPPPLPQLQIQSKGDLDQKLFKQKLIIQPSKFSLDYQQQCQYRKKSQILQPPHSLQPQQVINNYGVNKNSQDIQSSKPCQILSNSNNNQHQQSIDAQPQAIYSAPSRQLQILIKKQQSNFQYLRTQLKQQIKLITFILLIDDQKQIRNKISQISTTIRKIKYRSLSNNKIEDIKTNKNIKNNKKLIQLTLQLKNIKTLQNKLNNKLSSMDTYINTYDPNQSNQQKPIQMQQHIFDQFQQDNYGINKFKIISSHKNIYQKANNSRKNTFQLFHPRKFNPNINFQHYDQNQQIAILQQYKQILNSTIQQTKQSSTKKQSNLSQQNHNLHQQIQMIKMYILQLDTYNRKIRGFSNKSTSKQNIIQHTRQYSGTKPKLSTIIPAKNLSLNSKNIRSKTSTNKLPTTQHLQLQTENSKISQSQTFGLLPQSGSIINILTKQCQEQGQSMNCQIKNQYYGQGAYQ